jgi:hypothetical protein
MARFSAQVGVGVEQVPDGVAAAGRGRAGLPGAAKRGVSASSGQVGEALDSRVTQTGPILYQLACRTEACPTHHETYNFPGSEKIC